MNLFAKSRLGRVILHGLCLLRHPGQSHWHRQGIAREFACRTLAASQPPYGFAKIC
jgi:hypothetical protein